MTEERRLDYNGWEARSLRADGAALAVDDMISSALLRFIEQCTDAALTGDRQRHREAVIAANGVIRRAGQRINICNNYINEACELDPLLRAAIDKMNRGDFDQEN
jgi:hypothetical protein